MTTYYEFLQKALDQKLLNTYQKMIMQRSEVKQEFLEKMQIRIIYEKNNGIGKITFIESDNLENKLIDFLQNKMIYKPRQ